MKAYSGSEGIAPRILDLGARWRWVVSFTARPLYPQGKSPWYSLDRRLGVSQSRSECGGKEKNSQPLPGLEPPIMQSVTQRHNIELSRFLSYARSPRKIICEYCYTRVYPKVSGLAAWSENCKWYSSLPLDAIVSLFSESI
jgi:hypothetical protein